MRQKFLDKSITNIRKKYPEYDEEKLEEISYGLEALYITFTKTIVIFGVSFILGIAKDVLCILIAYNVIRTTAFGMHAKKSWHCYIISGILFIGTAFICKYIYLSVLIKYLISFALSLIHISEPTRRTPFISLIIYAPADTYKRPLVNKYKRRKYRVITIMSSLIYLIFIIMFKNNIISSYLCFGLLDASLMINPLIYKLFKLPYNNYKNYDVTYG